MLTAPAQLYLDRMLLTTSSQQFDSLFIKFISELSGFYDKVKLKSNVESFAEQKKQSLLACVRKQVKKRLLSLLERNLQQLLQKIQKISGIPTQKPQAEHYLWVDASYCDKLGVGVGFVLKDAKGLILVKASYRIDDVSDSGTAEKAAILIGIQAALSYGVSRLKVYTDCECAYKATQVVRSDNFTTQFEFLKRMLDVLQVEQIKREFNKEADMEARSAIFA